MNFIEKKLYGNKIWELQLDIIIPCTEEEERIYGVKFKKAINRKPPYIVKKFFADGGEYYEAISDCLHIVSVNSYFKSLEKAQEFLIKEYKTNET